MDSVPREGAVHSDLTFPVKVNDIAKFERKNNVSIHLYGCDKDK